MIYTSSALILAVAAMRGASAAPARPNDSIGPVAIGSTVPLSSASAIQEKWSRTNTQTATDIDETPLTTATDTDTLDTATWTDTPDTTTAVTPSASAGGSGGKKHQHHGHGWHHGWYNKDEMCGGPNAHSKVHHGTSTGGDATPTPASSDTTSTLPYRNPETPEPSPQPPLTGGPGPAMPPSTSAAGPVPSDATTPASPGGSGSGGDTGSTDDGGDGSVGGVSGSTGDGGDASGGVIGSTGEGGDGGDDGGDSLTDVPATATAGTPVERRKGPWRQ